MTALLMEWSGAAFMKVRREQGQWRMGGGRGLWKKPVNLEEERRAISEVEKKEKFWWGKEFSFREELREILASCSSSAAFSD